MWRDVPNLKDWEKLCEKSGLTAIEVNTFLAPITQALQEYYSIPKTQLELLNPGSKQATTLTLFRHNLFSMTNSLGFFFV
ncbi:hypothetical protein [Legionella bozemanae]|uniref:hypothetical protein n=1 Tax=Legionella bozemanae TaxID=447 RepID=UPI0010412933|nr:hypothetical protein [Legionella bozemanae]